MCIAAQFNAVITMTEQRGGKRWTSRTAQAGSGRDGLRAQGLRTRNAIVHVARKLILEGGCLEFSMRAVAHRVGITVSNLQYYFPSKTAILRAVMALVIEEYMDEQGRVRESRISPREALDALLERSLRDAKNVEKAPLWWHFCSLAPTDQECSELLDEWHEMRTREWAQLILATNPERGVIDSVDTAEVIIAMIDGLTLHLGKERRERACVAGLEASFLALVKTLVGRESRGTASG
jgi:AcrR family transcriptional regulator